jgi:hypothetical protein
VGVEVQAPLELAVNVIVNSANVLVQYGQVGLGGISGSCVWKHVSSSRYETREISDNLPLVLGIVEDEPTCGPIRSRRFCGGVGFGGGCACACPLLVGGAGTLGTGADEDARIKARLSGSTISSIRIGRPRQAK